jgi:protein required for attachment to host cells
LELKLSKHAIPHGAFVFVGDGRKALSLRNEGDEKFANFVTERVLVDQENPPTHEQGTDEPGRGFARANTSRRSAMEPTDWHKIEEHRFAQRVSAALAWLSASALRRRS